MKMYCNTPCLAKMDRILSGKRKAGLRGVKLFVQKSDDCTHEDIARGYCMMEEASDAGSFTDISNVEL